MLWKGNIKGFKKRLSARFAKRGGRDILDDIIPFPMGGKEFIRFIIKLDKRRACFLCLK